MSLVGKAQRILQPQGTEATPLDAVRKRSLHQPPPKRELEHPSVHRLREDPKPSRANRSCKSLSDCAPHAFIHTSVARLAGSSCLRCSLEEARCFRVALRSVSRTRFEGQVEGAFSRAVEAPEACSFEHVPRPCFARAPRPRPSSATTSSAYRRKEAL